MGEELAGFIPWLLSADRDPADHVDRNAIHLVHAPGQTKVQARAWLVIEHFAEPANDRTLAGPHLSDPSSEVSDEQKHGELEEVTHG
jgi:hypothetical protein